VTLSNQRRVTVHDTPVSLSRCEYQLLLTLVTEPERTFTRAELLCAVCGERSFSGRLTATPTGCEESSPQREPSR
jgi:DNA-binding response OmpR family regulator